jgi:hypothetical protein
MKITIVAYFCFLFYSCTNAEGSKVGEVDGSTDLLSLDTQPLRKTYIKPPTLAKNEYIQFVIDPANGLLVNKQVGNFIFSLLYKPEPFVAISNQASDSLTKENYERELNESKDLQYFTCKIKIIDHNSEFLKYKLSSMAEYEQRVDYFAFRMQQDIKLIEGKDTLDCVLYHYERNYGTAPNAVFSIGFPKSKNDSLVYDKTLSYDEKVFGLGKVNITISKENIVRIPEIKLN